MSLKKMLPFHFMVLCLVIYSSEAVKLLGHDNEDTVNDCDSPIYCRGELLKTMQLAQLFEDGKTFVDLFQLHEPEVTLRNFELMIKATNNKPNRTRLEIFLNENFSQESEVDNWNPPDWIEYPLALRNIRDPTFQKWAYDLNAVWKTLLRKIKPQVFEHPNRHSILHVENAFIVPGGRFEEFYYWDSYWAMTGMLICGMQETVRGILENFYHVVETYGFIPNGGRVYYLMRSHPPFLIRMTDKYLEFTKDTNFLASNIATLEREFDFFLQTKMMDVEKNGKIYKLARYVVRSQGPRPESYKEDYDVGQRVEANRLERLYNDLKAAAESGWDFSSRWYDDSNGEHANLSTISTSRIIPVELNALLEENARLLSKFHRQLNNSTRAKHYLDISKQFQDAIDNVLWNEDEKIWLDYDTVKNVSRNRFYPTNLSPLYTSSYNKSKAKELAESSVLHLQKHGITEFLGGTPASTDNTGEQWDYPNAWAPLQSFIILGLRGTEEEPAVSVARTLASRWLRANQIGFSEYGQMFEKYDADHPGQYGGGGEYTVQAGFAFTNGVAMELLQIYSTTVYSDDEDSGLGSDEAER